MWPDMTSSSVGSSVGSQVPAGAMPWDHSGFDALRRSSSKGYGKGTNDPLLPEALTSESTGAEGINGEPAGHTPGEGGDGSGPSLEEIPATWNPGLKKYEESGSSSELEEIPDTWNPWAGALKKPEESGSSSELEEIPATWNPWAGALKKSEEFGSSSELEEIPATWNPWAGALKKSEESGSSSELEEIPATWGGGLNRYEERPAWRKPASLGVL